ncbi:enoyl-CoA hydratase-related protein [Streptomyces sp. NPDC007971]|uniref:enoyl-CoA hydratase-related protein n=1 Tax=Streptomyces sp. NPDC007971 TaxID=3364799 RepID=UPI0036E62453
MTTKSTTGAPTVHTEEQDGVLVITIDRPKARNAVDGATARALADAFDRLDSHDDLMVGVLTGAGGTFSAGMDLKDSRRETPQPSLGEASQASP